MSRRFLVFLSLLLLAVLTVTGCQQTPSKKTEPREANNAPAVKTLQELAAKDPYNNGCVSCHKKQGDLDRSLPAYVKRIAGHPTVSEGTVNACYFCHDPEKNYELYKRFYRGLHKAHWGSDIFYGSAKGQCFSCHTVETNGVAGIKNYPAAGYRSGSAGPATRSSANTTKQTPADKTEKQPETDKDKEDTTDKETPPKTNKQSGVSGGSTAPGAGLNQMPTPTP